MGNVLGFYGVENFTEELKNDNSYVGAVDGDDFGLHGPILQQPAEQLVEDSVVGVLA